MSEREDLEKVLARYTGFGIFRPHEVRTLVEAARKHLDTLPKTVTKWRVSHYMNADRHTWRTTDTEKEALDSGQYALACGKRYVCVDEIQVPA